MAAFDRVRCGIEGLDSALDNIRMGDNVVWQVTSLDDFRPICDAFVRQATADGRNLIYMRFASHPRLVPERTAGVKEYRLDPLRGFETFTAQAHDVIGREGRDAFYVFDSLSDLQVAWSADMTMGNFFRLTCPYLFDLDTVAYFPVIRGEHSFAAIAKIRDTTQLLIDVMPDKDGLFIHPLKVWNRYSPTMFLPHRLDLGTGEVKTLTAGVDTSRFYTRMSTEMQDAPDRNVDSWDRFFSRAREDFEHGELPDATLGRMCNMMMTKDKRMRGLVKRYFTASDYFDVRRRMVGTGMVGGKACGMLLARKIVEKELPDLAGLFEPHDSFYVGTDVFYTFIVENGLWPLRMAQRGEGYFSVAPELRRGIEEGEFPAEIRQAFSRILDYYGQCPIIVRSSSYLEDGFGNAFAGKYDSVFLPNLGSPAERLSEFEHAVKIVYASTMNPSALEYRKINGLDTSEEQMALLVQRVSGSRYGDGLFMPTAAGIGYSRSAYRWLPDMDPDAGMLRLVMGLGTKAVDRTGHDYPRIVSLDRPTATTMTTDAERHRFSQRTCDLIDLNANAFVERDCTEVASYMPNIAKRAVMEHDRSAEESFRNRGQRREVLFASCSGLAANRRFTSTMSAVLKTLRTAYDYPVDIEFTVNVGETEGDAGEFVINLLQCRPLQSLSGGAKVDIPDVTAGPVLLRSSSSSMGNSVEKTIGFICYVNAKGYHDCPYARKLAVARAVGEAGAIAKRENAVALLVSPGRIGTSSPDLGVGVNFAEIAPFSAIVEYADAKNGFSPELSYGSHMFQDLVEASILYCAVLENSRDATLDLGVLDGLPEVSLEACEKDEDVAASIRLLDVRGKGLELRHDMMSGRTLIAFTKPR